MKLFLQSCNTPLGYEGLLVSGQAGEGLGKKMVIELGGVHLCRFMLLLPGTWDSRSGQSPGSPTGGIISLLEEVTQVPQSWARSGAG